MKKNLKLVHSFLNVHQKKIAIMRNTVLLLLISTFQVLATNTYSQTKQLDLKLKGATVKEVLVEIESQSEFYFLYNSELIDVTRVVDISVKGKKIDAILTRLFEKDNVNIEIDDRYIILTPMMEKTKQQNMITGTVTSAEDESGLPGVNVIVKGTAHGTVTDVEGNYKFDVTGENPILVFSSVGFVTKEVAVGNQTVIDMILTPDLTALDEIVVVGYGTQQRGSVTGAISSVSAKDINELPVVDAGSALQGRVPGVLVLSAGNNPGDGVTIRIRGRRSLTATNDPLYVVDGIPYEGNINDINPNDIKSMEVLKDASATAIYGSRGANGVILITTNRGGDFKTIVSYKGWYGVTSVLGKPDIMNSEEYIKLRIVGGRTFNAPEEEAIEKGVDTDWMDLVVNNGHKQNHQLSIRGGGPKTGVLISASLYDEQAIVKNHDFLRKTLRLNLDHQANSWFRVGISMQVSDQLQNVGTNVYQSALLNMPLAEPYDDEGNIIYEPGADPLRWNPLADLVPGAYVDERTRFRVFGNIFAEIDIFDDLTYHMNYGPDYQQYHQGQFRGSLSSARKYGAPDANKYESATFTNTFENYLNYTKIFNEYHTLKATGLFSIQDYTATNTAVGVKDLPYEHQLFHNLSTGEEISNYDSDLSEWGIMSFMARLNYAFMDRYHFTITARYDGSSRLSEGKKWGLFPSAAFLWRISSEEFMSKQNVFSDLSLRVSYGVTGNTGIDPYQTKGDLRRTIYNFGDIPAYGYAPNTIANPDLRWESSATANIGIGFGIGNSISGSFDLYQTKTTNLLLTRMIPVTSGYQSILENIGETMNRGFEFNISGIVLTSRDFKWTVDLNFFGNREQIIDLYGDKQDDIGNRWFIGEPLTVYYDYEKLGIWQLDEANEAETYQVAPGTIKVNDVDDNGIINQDDRIILGSNIPFGTVGLGSRLTYKNFDLSFLLFSVFGHTIYNDFEVGHSTLQGRYNNLNVDYWTEDNPTNDHPKPDASRERPLYGSTRGYQSGNFIKVKNIQLGYAFPANALTKLGARDIRVYLNFDTPFIFSKLPGNLDPEVYSGRVTSYLPSTRMVSLGVNIDF